MWKPPLRATANPSRDPGSTSMKPSAGSFTISLLFVCCSLGSATLAPSVQTETPVCSTTDIEFRILPDKLTYAPGASIRIKLLVTNTSKSPFYLFRYLNQCSSTRGFASVEILDARNREVRDSGCAAQFAPIRDGEVPAIVMESASWIQLKPDEIYGGEVTFTLPKTKGTYTLKSELFPTSFSDRQLQILSQNHMKVLECPVPAPPVTVNVR